jgi:hypothetical protein
MKGKVSGVGEDKNSNRCGVCRPEVAGDIIWGPKRDQKARRVQPGEVRRGHLTARGRKGPEGPERLGMSSRGEVRRGHLAARGKNMVCASAQFAPQQWLPMEPLTSLHSAGTPSRQLPLMHACLADPWYPRDNQTQLLVQDRLPEGRFGRDSALRNGRVVGCYQW